MKKIQQAAELIRKGELVAFPTETVYGLGADACNQVACEKIFFAKGRPRNNPLIVHVASIQQAEAIAVFNDDAYKLADFWPGALTMVLPLQSKSMIDSAVSAGLDTIAIRIPANKVALALIQESGCTIAAPSANKSGRLSATKAVHVSENFSDSIFILEASDEACYGLESTIIDLSTKKPTILRYGFITPENIAKKLGKDVEIASKLSKVKAPGMLYKHYSPKAKLRLDAKLAEDNEAVLNFGKSNLNSKYDLSLSRNGSLAEAAANLFDYLHKLDILVEKHKLKGIAVAAIPDEGIGLAINDRLRRAVEK